MPRTKKRTSKRESADLNVTENITIANQTKSTKEILDDFEAEKKNIENSLSDSRNHYINMVENAFLMVKINLSSSLQMNLYEYIAKDSNPVQSSLVLEKKKPEKSSKTDIKTAANKTTRQTRASSKMNLHCISAPIPHESSESQYKTPVNRPPLSTLATVTPKVNMSEPMSIMRRPNQGEVAISMTGSPLMVSSVSRDDMATVSVPLANGNIISILPRTGAHNMDVSFDEQTKKELFILKGNIEGLLNMRQVFD